MPVLIERCALIVRSAAWPAALPAAAPEAPGPGGGAVFTDGELTALASDWWDGLRPAYQALLDAGLASLQDGEPGDVAVVGALDGPDGWWPWLELAVVPGPGGEPALAARLAGGAAAALAVPEGAIPAGRPRGEGLVSLSPADRPLRHLRREGSCDLYRDLWTGEEVRVAHRQPPVRLAIEGAGGVRWHVTAQPVAGRDEIEVGLMFRTSLAPGTGMLFRFGWPDRHEFWMKNTLVPLDLLFIDPDGLVANVEHATPLTLARRGAARPVREVLELPAGWCEAHGVAAGARVSVVDGD